MIVMNIYEVGDVKDRVCVLLDDMSDSCGTLCKVTRIKNQMTSLMLIQNFLHRQLTCWRRPEQRGWLVSFLCSDFVLKTLLNISNSFEGIVTHGVLSGSALQVLIQLPNSIYQITIRNKVDWLWTLWSFLPTESDWHRGSGVAGGDQHHPPGFSLHHGNPSIWRLLIICR